MVKKFDAHQMHLRQVKFIIIIIIIIVIVIVIIIIKLNGAGGVVKRDVLNFGTLKPGKSKSALMAHHRTDRAERGSWRSGGPSSHPLPHLISSQTVSE